MQRALQQIAVVNFVHDKHDFHKPFSIQNFKIEYFCFYFDYKKKVIKVSLKLRISILCQQLTKLKMDHPGWITMNN